MTTSLEKPASAPRRRRARRWLRLFVILFLLAGIIALAAPSAIPWIISIKLRSEIAARLNARLELGKVTYLWPYGVRIDHARLIGSDNSADQTPLFEVGQVELTLAKLPIGTGPLLIEKVEIRDPFVHLIRTTGGLAGTNLVKGTSTTEPNPSSRKLSDLFELRHLAISGGKVEYEDHSRSGLVSSVVWDDLNMGIETTPTGKSNYQFQFTAKNAPLAVIDASGDIDVDTLLLNISRLSMVVQTDADKPSVQLPPRIQALCRKFAVGGQVNLEVIARIPLHDLNNGAYAAQLSLHQGSCQLPDWDARISPVELTMTGGNIATGLTAVLPTTLPSKTTPDIHVVLSALKINSGNQMVQIDGGEGTISPQDGTWSIEGITGLADLGDGPGPIRKANVSTHLPFEITGGGDFGSGTYALYFGTGNASAMWTPRKLSLSQIVTNVKISAEGLKIINLTGVTCGGQVTMHGDVGWNDPVKGLTYGGNISVDDLDMRQVADILMDDEQSRQMASGDGELNLQFSGAVPPAGSAADAFSAKGDFDIRHGHFMDIPVLKDVLANSKESNAATVGEAAAKFSIAHQRVHFQQAAASAPAIGVQGHGELGFDGTVNMSFIVTPLADWHEKLASTNVPILNSIGAMIVGKAQKVVNVAESVVLYQYRVTGTIKDPKTEQVPAPAITDAIKPLFQKMSGKNDDDSVAKELRAHPERDDPTTNPEPSTSNQ
jgi:hypothetical protein